MKRFLAGLFTLLSSAPANTRRERENTARVPILYLKGRRWIPQPPAVPYEPAQIPKSAPMGLRAAHPRQPRSSTSRIQSRMRTRVVVSATMSVVSVIMSAINELNELSHSEGATRRGPQRLHKAISLRVRLDRSKYGRCGWDLFLKCMQLDAIARLVVLIRWLEDRRKHLMRETIKCNQRCN